MNLNLTSLLWAWFSLWQDPAPLLNALLRSGLLLGIALFLARFLRGARPETRVLIYRAALLSTVGIALLVVVPSAVPAVSRWNIALYSSPSPVASSPPATVPSAVAPSDAVRVKHHVPADGTLPAHKQEPASATLSIEKATPRDTRIDIALGLLFGVWPLVSLWFLGRLLWCHLRIVWMRGRAQKVSDPATLEGLRAACAAIGVKMPSLRCSKKAHGPFLCGIWRPMILLPTDYAEQFAPTALRAIFMHEAAHIRGRDCAWTYARRIAIALLWPQPLLWVLSRQMEVAGEEACDLAVLEGGCAPRDYARCLVDLAERLCLTRTERAVGAGVVPRRSILPRRVEQILKGVPQAPRLGRGARWAAAAVAFCLCAGSIAFAIDVNTPLGATGEIGGRVLYEDGRPAAGISVEADMWETDESRLLQQANYNLTRRTRNMMGGGTTTGADGSYHLKGLLAGATFNVMVDNGLFSPLAGPPGWVGAAQTVKTQKNRKMDVKDIVLTHGAFIEGRIEDAISGKPLANMSFGCHGPHRPNSTGFISSGSSDSNGRFTLRVSPGKNWVYWNGPVENLRAEVRYSGSTYEKDLSVVRSGGTIYGNSDFVSVSVEKGVARYTRSGSGGIREADSITLQPGQTRHMTFRLSPLHIKERPGKTPLVILSDTPPLPGSTPLPWNPNSTLPNQAKGTLKGRVTFPGGKPAASVALIVQMQNRAVETIADAPTVYSDEFDKLPRAQKAMLHQNIITGADGSYRVTGLLDAPYDIVYTPSTAPPLSQWIGAPIANIAVKQSKIVQVPDMVLQSGAIISGQITDAMSKRGLPQCFLDVDDRRRPPSIPMSEQFDADKNGRFSFRVLPGAITVGLNFYDASISNSNAVKLGSREYDWGHTNILVDGRTQKPGSVARVTVREGQSLSLNLRLPPTAGNSQAATPR